MTQDRGRPINEVPFDEVVEREKQIEGWVYPRRSISSYTQMFRKSEQLAISMWAWIAIIMFLLSIPLWLILDNWLWTLLLPLAVAIWRINRGTMGDFFIENLKRDREFYEYVQKTSLGESVKVVFQGE